jgi:hypothetical protein
LPYSNPPAGGSVGDPAVRGLKKAKKKEKRKAKQQARRRRSARFNALEAASSADEGDSSSLFQNALCALKHP